MRKHLLNSLCTVATLLLQYVATAQNITTIAGYGTIRRDTVAATSGFVKPTSVVADAAGNLFITDISHHIVRKVSAATGIMVTIAGTDTAGFSGDGGPATASLLNTPISVAVDAAGNVYICDAGNYRIRMINTAGTISTIAGNGSTTYNGEGLAATAANMGPSSIAINTAGDIYFTDNYNERVRKISGGVVTTVAGAGVSGFSGDGGSALLATMSYPESIALSVTGDVFFYDHLNERIRKINVSGTITTIAGNGTTYPISLGVPATSTGIFMNGSGNLICVDDTGNVYISQSYTICKINSTGLLNGYLGFGTVGGFAADGGPATAAAFFLPAGIAIDGSHNMYIAESGSYLVRKVSTAGILSTVAGNNMPFYTGDNGKLSNTRVRPLDLAKDTAGNIYFSDIDFPIMRKITPAGTITRYAGKPGTTALGGDGGPALEADLPNRNNIATDRFGNVFITQTNDHTVRKINAAGVISRFAGTGSAGYTGDHVAATSTKLNYPSYLTTDTAGNVYILDKGNNRIRKVDVSGTITTYAGNGTLGTAGDGGPATAAQLNNPNNIKMDKQGNLYIMDYMKIRKVDAAGIITTIAGDGTYGHSPATVPAVSAQIGNPLYLFLDDSDNVYFTEIDYSQVKKINAAGYIQVVAGLPATCGFSGDGGPALAATFCQPGMCIFDNHHNLYISDGFRLRFVCSNDSVFSSVTITVAADTLCPGQLAVFTATAVNPGSTATYQWQENGVDIAGATSTIFSSGALTDLDAITCTISSTNPAPCASSGIVISNTIVMHILPAAPTPSAVAVVASPGSVSFAGQTITYTASYIGAGSSPSFQWYKGGIGIPGATSNPYVTNTVANGDNISVTVHTSNLCATPDSASGSIITGAGINNINVGGAMIELLPNPNNGSFTIKGEFDGEEDVILEITNTIGALIYTEPIQVINGMIEKKIRLPLATAKGIYFARLQTQHSVQTRRFLIE